MNAVKGLVQKTKDGCVEDGYIEMFVSTQILQFLGHRSLTF